MIIKTNPNANRLQKPRISFAEHMFFNISGLNGQFWQIL